MEHRTEGIEVIKKMHEKPPTLEYQMLIADHGGRVHHTDHHGDKEESGITNVMASEGNSCAVVYAIEGGYLQNMLQVAR